MEMNNLHIMTGQVYQGVLYAACYEINALIKMNIHSGDIEFIGHFLNEEYFIKALYRDSIIIRDTIYFIPDKAESIGVYHISESLFESIKLPKEENEKMGYDGILYDNKILLVPFDLRKQVLVFDINKNLFEYKESLNLKIKNLIGSLNGKSVYRIINVENRVILPIVDTCCYIEIYLPQEEVVLKKIENEIVKGVLPEKNKYWIYMRSGRNIYECSNNQHLKKLKIAGESNVFPVFCYDGKVLALDKASKQFCQYLNDLKIPVEINNKNQIELSEIENNVYFREVIEGERRILYSINMNGIIICNNRELNFLRMVNKEENILVKYIENAVKNGAQLMDEKGIGLSEYLKYICHSI